MALQIVCHSILYIRESYPATVSYYFVAVSMDIINASFSMYDLFCKNFSIIVS